jgi:hypothetical protein
VLSGFVDAMLFNWTRWLKLHQENGRILRPKVWLLPGNEEIFILLENTGKH